MLNLFLLVLFAVVGVGAVEVQQLDLAGVGNLAEEPGDLLAGALGLSSDRLAVDDFLVALEEVTRVIFMDNFDDGVIDEVLAASSGTASATFSIPC